MEWALAMGDRARRRHEVWVLESGLNVVRSAIATLPDGGGLDARARVRLLEAQLLVMKAEYGEAAKPQLRPPLSPNMRSSAAGRNRPADRGLDS